MKSKIAVSLLVIALAAALMGGATFAYFTSEAQNTDNVFSTGTLNISITDPAEAMFTIANMQPGDQVSDTITIRNNGSLPFKFKGVVSGTNYVGQSEAGPNDAKLSDMLNVVVTLVNTNGDERNDVVFEGTLTELLGEELVWDQTNAADWPFEPGWTATYKIDITFNSSAGNVYQNTAFNGAITFTATQWDNPGWSQNLSQ